MDNLVFIENMYRNTIDIEEWKERQFAEGCDFESQLIKIEKIRNEMKTMDIEMQEIKKEQDKMKIWIKKHYTRWEDINVSSDSDVEEEIKKCDHQMYLKSFDTEIYYLCKNCDFIM
jgi:hypothetical protein